MFVAAGFSGDENEEDSSEGSRDKKLTKQSQQPKTEDEMTSQGRTRIKSCGQSDAVKAKMLQVFNLYMSGKSTDEIANEMQISKRGVSCHFKRIEEAVGFSVVRSRRTKRVGKARCGSFVTARVEESEPAGLPCVPRDVGDAGVDGRGAYGSRAQGNGAHHCGNRLDALLSA